MLFSLENINDGKIFYLTNKIEFIVGRKDCDVLIQNDQSISRKHAIIRLKENYVTLEDCGSKYKTLHQNQKVSPNEEIKLQNNDIIQFGVISSQFRFKQYNFVTTGTRLSSSLKTKLKKDLDLIGGTFIENWSSECTHLTVEEITLTVKVLHALIDGKPIVLPAYWAKFAENVAKNMPPPNIDDYNNPPMAEALLSKVEFDIKLPRKGLFKGKMFVFLKEKNKKQMEDVIKKLGGISISWEKDPMPLEDIVNSPKEFLLIQISDQEEDPSFNGIIKHFCQRGQRAIPLQEIAMAIVHGSCEKDCNPNFNRVGRVFPVSRAKEPTQNNALAANTESEYYSVDDYKKEEVQIVIPDTIDPSNELIKLNFNKSVLTEEPTDGDEFVGEDTVKRARNEQEGENPFKKMKLEKEETKESEKSRRVVKETTKEEVPERGSDVFISKASQKRKAEEEVSMNEIRQDRKANPFAVINKKARNESEVASKRENPFSMIKKADKNAVQLSNDNPFKLLKRNTSENNNEETTTKIFTSTRLENKTPEKTFNYSKISKMNSSELNATWISKKNTSCVKNENADEFDKEMKSFIDLFKDKVVVEIMSTTSLRPKLTIRDTKDGINITGGKNFKKFQKVKPLHPQSTIIGKENFVAMCLDDTKGIHDSRKVLPDSDDESFPKNTKKRPPKKFLI